MAISSFSFLCYQVLNQSNAVNIKNIFSSIALQSRSFDLFKTKAEGLVSGAQNLYRRYLYKWLILIQ